MSPTIDLPALLEKLPNLDPRAADGSNTDEFKLTGPPWPAAESIYDAVFSGGRDAIVALIAMLGEGNAPAAYRPRYLLHGMAVYAARPGKLQQRTLLCEVFASQLAGNQPAHIKAFLIRELEFCGTKDIAPTLGSLLNDAELGDPAAKALLAIRTGAAEQFRAALPAAQGRRRLALVQALGVLRDADSTAALKSAAADPDPDLRLTAAWSLANIGDPSAVDAVLAVADAEGFQRIKGAQAALLLAETLAAAGDKPAAAKVYTHLQQTRTDKSEQYVRDIARDALAALQLTDRLAPTAPLRLIRRQQ